MSNLGITLKKLRESRNLTVKELAEKSGTGNGTIGNIERGANKATVKTLEKISLALSGFTLPPYKMVKLSAISNPYTFSTKVLINWCISCACSGEAVSPVPIAQTGS